jgi:FAD binding domain
VRSVCPPGAPWTVNHQFATTIARGRVFCAGDAVHRHPPTNGLGSNTSIQDSYNLAWKLAHVVSGAAAPALLDTYDTERAPVARQIVERANQSIVDTGRIIAALELTDTTDVAKLDRQMALRTAPGPDGDRIRAALRDAIAYKAYEFDAHGVEHNHRYVSTAVVPDGTPEPEFTRDRELFAKPTTWPGAKLPHTWVTAHGIRTSTLDLVGHGRFSVVTGIGGEDWLEAAGQLAEKLGVEITPVSIGPGQPYEDRTGPGPSCARSPTAACCWCVRTCTSRPGILPRPRRRRKRTAGSPTRCPPSCIGSCSGVADQRKVVSKRISSSDTVVWTSTCCTPTMPAAAAARTLGRRSSTNTISSAGRSSRRAAIA